MAADHTGRDGRESASIQFSHLIPIVEDYFSTEALGSTDLASRTTLREQHLQRERSTVAVQLDMVTATAIKMKRMLMRYSTAMREHFESASAGASAAAADCQAAARNVDDTSALLEARKATSRKHTDTPPRQKLAVGAFGCNSTAFLPDGSSGQVPVAVAAQSLLWGEDVSRAAVTDPFLLRHELQPPFICNGSVVLGSNATVGLRECSSGTEVTVRDVRTSSRTCILRLVFTSSSRAWQLVRHIRMVSHHSSVRAETAAGGGPAAAAAESQPASCSASDELREARNVAHEQLKTALQTREDASSKARAYRAQLDAVCNLLHTSERATRAAVDVGMDTFVSSLFIPDDDSCSNDDLVFARAAASRFVSPGCAAPHSVWGLHMPSPHLKCPCAAIWETALHACDCTGAALIEALESEADPPFKTRLRFCLEVLTWLRLVTAWHNWKLQRICTQQAERTVSPVAEAHTASRFAHTRRQDSLAVGYSTEELALPAAPAESFAEQDGLLQDIQLD